MSEVDLDSVNKKIYTLACELHGLSVGDTRALASYERIKQFLIENDWFVECGEEPQE